MTLLAVIGYPIGHSLSPVLYNAAFPAMGIDAQYETWAITPDDLPGAIERLRGGEMMGMNVTVPHKQAVMPLLDEVGATAAAIGAVNCIAKVDGRLVGHNTDKYGFIRSLREAGCEPSGLRVLVLGVGGSARAVAYGLIEAGVAAIALAGRTPEHVVSLALQLESTATRPLEVAKYGWDAADLQAASADADLIVNCTPVGMRHTDSEDSSPIDGGLICAGVWVSDLVYNPADTCLLRLAREAGARPIAGLEMLIYQAAESVRLWTGREAPIDIMRKAARAALGQED